MWKRILETEGKEETLASYLGLLSHGNAKNLSGKIKEFAESLNKVND